MLSTSAAPVVAIVGIVLVLLVKALIGVAPLEPVLSTRGLGLLTFRTVEARKQELHLTFARGADPIHPLIVDWLPGIRKIQSTGRGSANRRSSNVIPRASSWPFISDRRSLAASISAKISS